MSSLFNQKSFVVIFTYSPTGLGHLRVTDALYHGLPAGVTPLLLGSQDKFIQYAHRLTSIYSIGRSIFKWTQDGIGEDISVPLYRFMLRSRTTVIFKQITAILDQRIDTPKTVLIVATHPTLAHQLAAVKQRLMKEKEIQVFLVVQVTDDSPQKIWYIYGADLIFVPSLRTKINLIRYAKKTHLPDVNIEVTPYPVSPKLASYLPPIFYKKRLDQLSADNTSSIHVSIPVSGAAVGLNFLNVFIKDLHKKSDRFKFHIISRVARYTQKFLNDIIQLPYVELYTSPHDRIIVDTYEQIFESKVIALEVTKPSEQAFKALLQTHQRGGCILLFAQPIGRQEYDNLDFLRRHHLIPYLGDHQFMWEAAQKEAELSGREKVELLEKAMTWRGLLLPESSKDAAKFVDWCLHNGIFKKMAQYNLHSVTYHEDHHKYELTSHGVAEFWKRVSDLLK